MTLFARLERLAKLLKRPYRPDSLSLMDLGLTRSEFSILQRSRPQTRQQMEGMAAKFGLSPQDIGRNRWQELDISLKCAQCAQAGKCLKYLSGNGEFSQGDCPNAETYKEMAAA